MSVFSNWFDNLFVSADERARNDTTTSGLIAVTEAEGRAGVIPPDEVQRRINQITLDGDYTERFKDPNLSPSAGFVTGLGEGADNIRQWAAGVIDGTTRLTLRSIPWQVYLILAIVGLLYLAPLLLALRRKT